MTKKVTLLIMWFMGVPVWAWNDERVQGRRYQITYLRCEGDYHYGAHRHRGQWELVYVSAGSLLHTLGGRSLRLDAGTAQLVRANDVHELRGSGFSFFNLEVPETLLDGLEALVGGSAPFPVNAALRSLRLAPALPPQAFDLEARAHIESTLQRLLLAYRPLEMVALVCRMFGVWLEKLEVPAGPAPAHADLMPRSGGTQAMPAWLSRAVSLAGSSADIPDLAVLEGWCGCSPSHMSRSFRRWLGCTPSAFLTGLRLERAARLLGQTNYPVGHIIAEVGFESPNYFHKLFRARHGLSPREYRGRYGSATHRAG